MSHSTDQQPSQEKDFFNTAEQPYYMQGQGMMQASLPNESTIATLGNVSLMLAGPVAGLALILGIITVIMAATAMRTYNASPTTYRQDSYKKVKGALIKGIIAMCVIPVILLVVFLLITFD